MFGLGLIEVLVIMVVALLVLGPDKIPEAARQLGKASAFFRRTLDEVKHDLAVAEIQELKEHSIKIFEGCPEDTANFEKALQDEQEKEVAPEEEKKEEEPQ